MKLFVLHRWEDGEPTKPRPQGQVMDLAEARAKNLQRPFKVKRFNARTRTFLRRKAALGWMREVVDRLKVNDVVEMTGAAGGLPIRIRRVSDSDSLPDVALPSQASSWPQIQKDIYKFVMGEFQGKVAWWGTCNCRQTRQGGSWSDHACCRAGDFAPNTKATGDEIERAVKQRFGGAILYIAWQVSLHYDHLHISSGRCSGCS